MRAELQAYLAADDAWRNELVRLFGWRAGDVRYTAEGRTGPTLTPLHAEYRRAADVWLAALDCERAELATMEKEQMP